MPGAGEYQTRWSYIARLSKLTRQKAPEGGLSTLLYSALLCSTLLCSALLYATYI